MRGWLTLIAVLGLSGCTSAGAKTPNPACADAVERVQQYRAPGQAQPLHTVVGAKLRTDPRPTQIEGWEPVDASYSNICYVTFRAMIGNERTRLTWSLDPKTGEIKAFNDAAKRYSGW